MVFDFYFDGVTVKTGNSLVVYFCEQKRGDCLWYVNENAAKQWDPCKKAPQILKLISREKSAHYIQVNTVFKIHLIF